MGSTPEVGMACAIMPTQRDSSWCKPCNHTASRPFCWTAEYAPMDSSLALRMTNSGVFRCFHPLAGARGYFEQLLTARARGGHPPSHPQPGWRPFRFLFFPARTRGPSRVGFDYFCFPSWRICASDARANLYSSTQLSLTINSAQRGSPRTGSKS